MRREDQGILSWKKACCASYNEAHSLWLQSEHSFKALLQGLIPHHFVSYTGQATRLAAQFNVISSGSSTQANSLVWATTLAFRWSVAQSIWKAKGIVYTAYTVFLKYFLIESFHYFKIHSSYKAEGKKKDLGITSIPDHLVINPRKKPEIP